MQAVQELSSEVWFCHLCLAKNDKNLTKCRICGRNEDFVEEGFEYALLGEGTKVFRASHAKTLVTDVLEADDNGWTALHFAAHDGNHSMVLELLRMGADVRACTIHGQTPLHTAVMSGRADCVSSILKHNPEVDFKTFYEKNTPLHLACESGYKAIVEVLVEKGKADVNSMNVIERTPLHLAGKCGRADIGAYLIGKGAKMDQLDAHGWTARQVAELDKHAEFAEMMVRSAMTDRQSTMKELPAAPYYGVLWTNLVNGHEAKKAELSKEIAQEERVQRDIALAKRKIKEKQLVTHLIDNNRNEGNPSVDLAGVSDGFYRKHKGTDKPKHDAYSVKKPKTPQEPAVTEAVKFLTDAAGIPSALMNGSPAPVAASTPNSKGSSSPTPPHSARQNNNLSSPNPASGFKSTGGGYAKTPVSVSGKGRSSLLSDGAKNVLG